MLLAALAGFALSSYVHVNTYFGRLPLGESTMRVHVWAILLMGAAIIIQIRMSQEERRGPKGEWLLRAAPRAVRWLVPALFVFSVANFINLAMTEHALGRGKAPFIDVARSFSSGWMLIFAFAFGAAWSLMRLAGKALPRCPNGHRVDDGDDFCPSCGAKVERAE